MHINSSVSNVLCFAMLCLLICCGATSAQSNAVFNKIAYSKVVDGSYRVHLMEYDGSGVTMINTGHVGTDDMHPDISNDGTRIAFINSTTRLCIYNTTDGSVDTLLDEGRWTNGPKWSPNDEWIAFSGIYEDGEGLYAIRPDGTGMRRVDDVNASRHCDWSYDGERLSLGTDNNYSTGELYYWDLQGDSSVQLTYTGDRPGETGGRWSPSGDTISYLFYDAEYKDLYLMEVATGVTWPLVEDMGFIHGCEWAPNGRILFSSEDAGREDIYSILPSGDSLTCLTSGQNGLIHGVATQFTYVDPAISYLQMPSLLLGGCDQDTLLQPVLCSLGTPASGGNVAIKIPDSVDSLMGVSFNAGILDTWDLRTVSIDTGYVLVSFANTAGSSIPKDTLVKLFDLQFAARRMCGEDRHIVWDTALSDDFSRKTKFSDTSFPSTSFEPVFETGLDTTDIEAAIPGDVNGDGNVDISDLTLLVNHLFVTFEPICIRNAAGLNGDCGLDISDLTTLINNLFISFEPLSCGCAGNVTKRVSSDISLIISTEAGTTSLSLLSDIQLKGIQVSLRATGTDKSVPSSLLEEGDFEMFYGYESDILHVGLLDLEGTGVIYKGESAVLTIEGHFEVISATVADIDNNSISPALRSGDAVLPIEFSLLQNYPNPFNPSTTIEFSLPGPGDWTLQVFNILGQEVSRFWGTEPSAGPVEVVWNSIGQASGVYMYRLTAGRHSATRTMMLLK